MAFDDRKHRETKDIDLAIVVAYALVTAFISLLSFISPVPGAVFGAGMVLFVAGYSPIAALFPGRREIGVSVRAALSTGASITVSAIIGLALQVSPPGFMPELLFVCLAALSIACAIVAYWRRQGLAPGEKFGIDTGHARRNLSAFFTGDGKLNKAIVVVLGLAVLASLLAITWVILMPAPGEPFTEFYLLGPDGKAGHYPLKFYTGEPGSLIAGIASHENRDVAYDLVVTISDGVNTSQLYRENVTLASGRTWEKLIELTPGRTGTHQKLEFLLYADGNYTAPYRDLHLWVDVRAPLQA